MIHVVARSLTTSAQASKDLLGLLSGETKRQLGQDDRGTDTTA